MGAAALAFACDSRDQVAGGSTEDFNGNPDTLACETVSQVELDDTSPIGFAPREALALIEGNYALGITWHHPCAPNLECRHSSCGDAGIPLVTPFAGTETVLHFEIQATGVAATVRYDGLSTGDPNCTEEMAIPVTVKLASDDGALDEDFQGEVRARRSERATLLVEHPAAQLQGALSMSVESDSIFRLLIGSEEGRLGTELAVDSIAGDSTEPLLRSFLSQSEGCSQEVARDSVLVEP